jgi:hypothetical protein
MEWWDQFAKTFLASIFLAFVMFAVFVAGQMHPWPNRGQAVATASSPLRGSPDARAPASCAPGYLDGRPVCGVPFARLIANPERYQGATIAVTGFLVTTGAGSQSLFPDEDSYRNSGQYERIEIGAIGDGLRPKLQAGVWVRIIGAFDMASVEEPWSLGAIARPSYIAEARPAPSVASAAAPAPPRIALGTPPPPPPAPAITPPPSAPPETFATAQPSVSIALPPANAADAH